jgi:hypothetical protein
MVASITGVQSPLNFVQDNNGGKIRIYVPEVLMAVKTSDKGKQ